MKKKKFILLGILFILLILLVCFFVFRKEDDKLSDAEKFKEEYEAYNGMTTEDGYSYPVVSVDENNVMYYATSEEVLKILKEGTGIIYFGTPSDPWSRNAVNVLLQASASTPVKRIYYLDLSKKYDVYEVENGQVVKTKEGSDAYYEMVDLLQEYLSNYLVYDGKTTVDTGVKRIFMPFVVFVKDGKVISTRKGTTDSHINKGNGYIELTAQEEEELFNYYVDKMTILSDASCNEDC